MEKKAIPLSNKYAIWCVTMSSGPSSAKQVRKGSVTHGLGADISLPQCLSERPGIWKRSNAQAESDLRAEISGSIVKVQRSGNTSRGTVTRSTNFFRFTHAHLVPQPLRRSLLIYGTCNSAARFNIGRHNILRFVTDRQIENYESLRNDCFPRKTLLLFMDNKGSSC